MIVENIVAQMLRSAGHKLYFFSKYSKEDAQERMELDFLIAKDTITSKHNISPMEVKSTNRYIVLIVASHEWCTHSEIGDTLLGVVLGDAFPKTVDAFLADHQLVLPVDSSDGKLHIQANYMI